MPSPHPGDALTPRRRVAYIVLLGALTALGPFTVDLYLPAFPALEADFHTSSAAIQLTLTGTMLGFGLGQLVIGPLSDLVGRRIPLLVATSVHIAASVTAAIAPNLSVLTVMRVLMGVGAAAGGVIGQAIVRDLFSGRRLIVVLSRMAAISGLAPVIAPLIGSALLLAVSWRGVFYVLAGYGVVMLLCALIVLPETLPRQQRRAGEPGSVRRRYRGVLTDRVFLGVLVIGAMTFSGLFSYLSSSSFLFQQTYGFTPQQFGMLFAVNSLGLVLGVQISARLAARFGPQWVLAYSTLALVASAAAIVVTDRLGLGMWGTIVPLFVFMSSCGFTFPCVQVLALERHGEAAGTAASLLGAANNAVAALASPLVGWISSSGTITATTMALVMIGCSAIGVASLWLIVRPRSIPALR